jgi:hypothetical protein
MIYRVYFQYEADGASGPEYFWKFSANSKRVARQRAIREYRAEGRPIVVLEVIPEARYA